MEVTRDESGRVLLLSGELCIYAAQELKDALRDHLQREGPIVINLSKVAECDTTALQLLISARKTADATDRALDFIGVPDEIRAQSAALGLSFFETATRGDADGIA